MEVTKTNHGPESPADLEWSQGAKNPRKENETVEETKIDLGMLSSNTTDHVVETRTETPSGEIRTEATREIPGFLENFEGTRKDRDKRTREWCLDIIKSNEYVHKKCLSNLFVVVIIDINNPKGKMEEDEANKIIEVLTRRIVDFSDTVIPKFNEFEFNDGLIIIDCYNSESVFWLKNNVVIEIARNSNRNLRIVSEYDFSNNTRIAAFLPGARRIHSEVRKLLFGPNPSLQWTIIIIFKSRREEDSSGLSVLFEANERALAELNKLSMKPYFGLSRGEFHICSSLAEWKSHLVIKLSLPRSTLASQFHCKNFEGRVDAINRKVDARHAKIERKANKSLGIQTKRQEEQKPISQKKNTNRRRRRRKPADKKNQTANTNKQTKELQQTKTTSTNTGQGKIRNKVRNDRRMKNLSSTDRSRYSDNRRRTEMRGLGRAIPWTPPIQSQSQSFGIPQLNQLSQLLNQLQSSNVLSNTERIPQAFHYNIEPSPATSHQFQAQSQLSQLIQNLQNPVQFQNYAHTQRPYDRPSDYGNYSQYSESRSHRDENNYDFRSSFEKSPLRPLTRDAWTHPPSRDEFQQFSNSDYLARDTDPRYSNSYTDRFDSRKRKAYDDTDRNKKFRRDYQPENRFDPPRRY